MLSHADMQLLADKQELSELVARYAWLVAQGRGAAVADLFSEDGEFLGLGHELRGRRVLARFYEKAAVPGAIVPMVGNVIFDVAGDTASGVSTLMGMSQGPGRQLLCAYYEDDCVRVEGRWRFSRRRAGVYFER